MLLKVTVLKPHRWAEAGRMVAAGEVIECDEARYRALLRNGMVEPLDREDAREVAPRRKPGAGVTHGSIRPRRERLTLPKAGELSQDGPTVEQWVAGGYPASKYPPQGYASKSTAAEIESAIAAQAAAAADKDKSET